MNKIISLAKIKTHFSDCVSRIIYNHERFIITKRNKPVAALVNIEDLQYIEQKEERQGLTSVADKWKDFDEIAEVLDDLTTIRKSGGSSRDVSF
jgi:prevent-host-death family protein